MREISFRRALKQIEKTQISEEPPKEILSDEDKKLLADAEAILEQHTVVD